MKWLKRLLELGGRSRLEVIDVGLLGPRLTLAELEALICGHPEVMRAVLQVCACRREQCQRAVEDKSNLLHGQTSFESGAAAGTTDLMATLQRIRQGQASGDRELRAWFSE